MTEFYEKLSYIRKLNIKDLYKVYRDLFINFNIQSKTADVIEELSAIEELPDQIYLGNTTIKELNNFNINDSLSTISLPDLLSLLLFFRINKANLTVFEKVKKLKKRKRRFKKRRLKRVRIIRKIKKSVFFKKFRRKSHKIFSMFNKFTIKNSITDTPSLLVKRMPLSERVITATNVDFFYKLHKNLDEEITLMSRNLESLAENDPFDFLIYLRNYNQKPYWKLRKSRIAHWRLFWNKTIKKQRYKGFLAKFLRNHERLSYSYTFFVNFFTKFNISWTRVDKLESFCKNILVENHNNSIIKVPLFFSRFLRWVVLKRRDYRLRKKVGRWSYLNFKRATRPWLQRKKNTPKIAKHIQPKSQYLGSISQFDIMTGCIHIGEPLLTHMIPPANEFKVNFLIRLHMYRYKSNTKCT